MNGRNGAENPVAGHGRYAQVSVMNSFDPGHARDLWWHCESEH